MLDAHGSTKLRFYCMYCC